MATLSPLEQQFADQQKKKRQNSSKSPLHDARPVNATGLPHPTLGGTPNPNVSGLPMNQGGQTLPQGFVPGPGKGTNNKTFTTSNVPAGGQVQEQMGAGGGAVQEVARSAVTGAALDEMKAKLLAESGAMNNLSPIEQKAQRDAAMAALEAQLANSNLSPLERQAQMEASGRNLETLQAEGARILAEAQEKRGSQGSNLSPLEQQFAEEQKRRSGAASGTGTEVGTQWDTTKQAGTGTEVGTQWDATTQAGTGTEVGTQWDVADQQQAVAEETINTEEFLKSADLVQSLSEPDKAEAAKILNEQGQAAFAKFVSERSMTGQKGGYKIDATLVQGIADAKTAFMQGGYDDFFKAHDQLQVLQDPNATEAQKSSANMAMRDILANPTEGRGAILSSQNFSAGNEALDRAVELVGNAGTSGTIDESQLEGLDEDVKAAVRTAANEAKTRADNAGRNFDDEMRRAVAGEMVSDLGHGSTGGIANPPPDWGAGPKASHYLNQMMLHARTGRLSPSWRGVLERALFDAKMISRTNQGSLDDAWARLENAASEFVRNRGSRVAEVVGNPADNIAVTEDGTTISGLVTQRKDAIKKQISDESREIAQNKQVLKSLDTLLAGGQLDDASVAALPPEMKSRVMDMQEKSRAHEIARRESALSQRFSQFEEGERQRIAAANEKARLMRVAPSLTQDVAGEFQTPGTMDRVASVEEKIDRGGMLTEQDMIGLAADERRRLQDRSTAAINRMTDVDQANAEIQLEARRRMLDPFTAAGGGSIYGQGNAFQTFGRNVMSGVEQRIARTLDDIAISADRERAGRKDAINQQYDQAIHKLSRVFATTPDKLSGAAQRRFEELESERANALTSVDVEVDRAVRDEQRSNIELLTGLQESRESAALSAEELNLKALQQAAGFAGGLDDRALREAEIYGRGAGGRETLAGEIERGQLGLAEKETGLREAEMYGGTEGVNIGQLSSLNVPRIIGMDGKLVPGISNDEFFRAQSEIEAGFRDRFGRNPNASEMMRILQGQSVGGRTTLDAELGRGELDLREEIERGQLEETITARTEDQRLERDRLGLEREIARAGELGYMRDPVSGLMVDTISGRELGLRGEIERGDLALRGEIDRGDLALRQEIERGRLGLDEDIERGRLALSRAEVFGGEDTISLSQIGDFGVDAILNADGSLAAGMDMASFMDASTRIEQGFNQRYGRSPSASEMNRIMQGQEVGGRSTLAASEAAADRRLQAEIATGEVTIDGKRQQTLQDFIERGQLTNETSALFADQLGYIRDPETGIRIQTLAGKAHDLQDDQFSESTRQFNAQFFGDMIDPETGDVREGLDAKQVANQVTQFNRQMANSERELTANIGQAWATITGETGTPAPVDAGDFGIDIGAMKDVNPMLWGSTDEYRRVSEGIRAMTGQDATNEQVMSILRGDEAMIDGAPTLEARELSTRTVQANMDRAVQISQFAEEIGLDRDVFEEAQDAADREWQVTTQDVAGIFGVSEQKWAEARNKYERELSAGTKPEEAARVAARHARMDFADFQSANQMFEDRWGQKSRAAAIDLGMTQEQWDQTKEAQQRMMDKENLYWDGIMQGVGVNVNLMDIRDNIDWDAEGFKMPDQAALALQDGIDELFSVFRDTEMGPEKLAGGGDSMLREGLTDMFKRDPASAMQTLRSLFNEDGMTKKKLRQYEANGVPTGVVMRMYGNYGGDAWEAVRSIAGGLAQHNYRGPAQQEELTDEQIRTVLENEYEMRNLTDEQWRQTIRDIRDGTQVKVPPKDWLTGIEPAELRMELLSLLHGGTSFAIAAKEPSVWETVGGFAGQIIGAGIGAATAGSDPGLKQNVVHVGRSSSGLNVYEFDYKPGLGPTGRYRGVMSNEIPQNAVIHRAIYDKYDAVDYSKIDVDFEKLI